MYMTIYVCIYVYLRICVNVYMYLCICVHVYMYLCICVFLYMSTGTIRNASRLNPGTTNSSICKERGRLNVKWITCSVLAGRPSMCGNAATLFATQLWN